MIKECQVCNNENTIHTVSNDKETTWLCDMCGYFTSTNLSENKYIDDSNFSTFLQSIEIKKEKYTWRTQFYSTPNKGMLFAEPTPDGSDWGWRVTQFKHEDTTEGTISVLDKYNSYFFDKYDFRSAVFQYFEVINKSISTDDILRYTSM
jgi:hypothetical protein